MNHLAERYGVGTVPVLVIPQRCAHGIITKYHLCPACEQDRLTRLAKSECAAKLRFWERTGKRPLSLPAPVYPALRPPILP